MVTPFCFVFQASSSSTSISHQPKGSSGTDTGTDLTSGSDTEAAPTALEQTFSPPMPSKPEDNTSALASAVQTKTTEESLPKTHASGETSTPADEVTKAVEVSPSGETRVSEKMTLDSSRVLHESANAKPAEKEMNTARFESRDPNENDVELSSCGVVDATADAVELAASANPGGADSSEDSGPSASA